MAFEGSCHCGDVTFKVDAELPGKAVECNCSICHRKGFLLAFFPATQFQLAKGEANLKSYKFGAGKIDHRFCTTCGTQAFAFGTNPDGSAARAVNLRCVPAIDVAKLDIQPYDGASA
jgi:hypothetical protein